MPQTISVVFILLLTICSSLVYAQADESSSDSIPADTLYDPEYYSDSDVHSIEEYMDPDETKKVDRADLLADLAPYPVHTVLFGPRAGYIYYDEIFSRNDMQELAQMEGFYVKQFIGEPKSTEYGIWPGFSFQYRYIGEKVPVFISIPKISFAFGILNTYDGSTSETTLITQDTAIVQYTPEKFQKMNFFLNYGFDLGYLFVIKKFRVSVNSGIDGRVWVRDLVDRSDVPEGLHVRNNEAYTWIYFPFHASFCFQPNNKFSIGVLAGLNYMATGSMQINFKVSDNYNNSIEANADKVKLSNKIGYQAARFLSNPGYHARVALELLPIFNFTDSVKVMLVRLL